MNRLICKTYKLNFMKLLYKLSLLTFLSLTVMGVNAQEVHEVAVSNFQFSPADITIEVGDTVRWTNADGFHNVGTGVFPENPETFGNETGSGWTYDHIFSEVGTNQYQCDIHPMMQGTVTVVDPTLSVSDRNSNPFTVYPNPVSDILYWKWTDGQQPNTANFTLFDLTGKVVSQFSMMQTSVKDVRNLNAGIYHYRIDIDGRLQSGKLVINR